MPSLPEASLNASPKPSVGVIVQAYSLCSSSPPLSSSLGTTFSAVTLLSVTTIGLIAAFILSVYAPNDSIVVPWKIRLLQY